MKNLLTETEDAIQTAGQAAKDVVYIGTSTHSCSWCDFKNMADIAYDAGYGCTKVLFDLRIVFKDGSMLSRWEYDGSEGWEYTVVDYPVLTRTLKSLFD